jgi:hypothetical protein
MTDPPSAQESKQKRKNDRQPVEGTLPIVFFLK